MKKRFVSLLQVLALLFSFTACAGGNHETTYILTEFETSTPGGMVQKTVHHYDKDWTLTGSTVYRDGQVDMEIVYERNDRGDVTSITLTTANLTQTEEHRCTYDSRGNLIRTDVYVDGAQTASTVTEYVFDEDGTLISQIQQSGGSVYEHFYNPDGTISTMISRMPDLGIHQTTQYTYDDHGNEIRSVTHNEAGVLIRESNSSYDKDGHIQVSVDTRYNENGTVAESTAAEYTWDGLVKTTHAMDAAGREVSRAVTEYDDSGNILRHEIYSGDRLMSRQVMTYIQVEVPVK